jgi:RNA polymerase sigma factor (sigma-70 family)
MTREESENMERLVDWRLKKWRSRTDYDDMRQEALIGAWKALESTRGKGFADSTVITKAADFAAREWLRSTKSDLPHLYWRRNYPPITPVSAQAHQASKAAYSPDGDGDRELLPPVEDFAPAVVDRLQAREVWVRALGMATPRQAAAMRATYRHGQTQQEYADQAGIHSSAVSQQQRRVVERLRQVLAAAPEEAP